MRSIILVLSIFAFCAECRLSALDRQWIETDARQNCTEKCKIECEDCKDPQTCSEDELKCGDIDPEVGPDCPPSEICVPAGCECDTVGTDGEKCDRICPPNCEDHEIECPGDTFPNGCRENNYCHPKGVGSDGKTCPGFCPKDCEDDEIKCTSPSEPTTGCAVEPSCVTKQKDNQDKFCTFQQCPLICNVTEQLCHGSIDHMGCKEADKCIPKDISDSGELCPGTCPVECEPEEVLCPGQVDYDEGPTKGCVGQDQCKPKAKDMNGDDCPDESASHDCPVTCPPDEVLCPPGEGPLKCKLAAECAPKSIDNDGAYCPTHSDCPTICKEHEVNCPALPPIDDTGCKNPDICVLEERDTNGDLCTVHCPIDCDEDTEVLCPGQRDVFGCVEGATCEPRTIKDRGTDEGGRCPGWCPPKCKHNEILCPSQIDPCDGCPTEEVCVVAETDKNGVFCPGKDYPNEPLSASHGCPRICDDLQGYSLCPVSEDESGCKPEETCMLRDLDNNNQWCNEWSNCPVICKDDEIVCYDGKDDRGCDYPNTCLPRGEDKDGNLCDRSCPMQCDESQQTFCNGGPLPNGCFEPDFCVDHTSGNDGYVCPGVCPPSCKPGEVIEPASTMDARGCPQLAKCVAAEVEYKISSEFTVKGINPDNFAFFYALLQAAIASALSVAQNSVSLAIGDPSVMDRQDIDYLIVATVEAIGNENKDSLLTKMKAPTFKTEMNTEIAKDPALKEAKIEVGKIEKEPIAQIKTVVGADGLVIPEVVIPGRDVLPPIIVEDVMTLRKEGESCGSCNCPPSFTAGTCERHLECVHNPLIADVPGTCMTPVICCKAMNAGCLACQARQTVEEFCSYPMNKNVAGCQGPTCGRGICDFGEECCMTCNEEGEMVESGQCASTLNGNLGCELVDCIPGGLECGETFCSPGEECCQGCDGPTGRCEEMRDYGGPGCPVVDCLPPGGFCGDVMCKEGGECCMMCDETGGTIPANRCSSPSMPCPLIICEAPITVEPPIIVEPPVFCCEAVTAECEACKKGMTVDQYCKEYPKMDGCSPIDECAGQECGVECVSTLGRLGAGICDGEGRCVEPMLNPCMVHGCEGKACGEECLMGDIVGWCDMNRECGYGEIECNKRLSDCLQECKEVACASDLDLSKGCNQMYSCSHACKMRDLGLDENECRQNCDRNGQSGCSPNINGYQFELCGPCTRERCQEWPTVEECEIGCTGYGKVSQLDKCLDTCKETACATDLDLAKGCNEMYSCSHACKIRQLGLDKETCKKHCDRNGQSGCSPAVKGYQFELCGPCTRDKCPVWPTPEECEIGCEAYGECEWHDMDGNCIDHCYGAFAIHLNEAGEPVCGCSGEECNEDPCDKCEAEAIAAGAKSWTCPC